MTQRIDELTGPVEVGKYYVVPTVLGMWYHRVKWWPVIGPRHNDTQCLDFHHHHYHLDGRFIREYANEFSFWRDIAAAPLMMDAGGNKALLPEPVWRRRKCLHSVSPSIAAVAGLAVGQRWNCHFDMWTGKQARHDGRGWICPHRSVPLADHEPDGEGVITCPLHMLRIDSATGRVLPPVMVPA